MSRALKHGVNGDAFDASALPLLPAGWCWTTLGVITENHDGRRVPVKATDRDCRPGPYPYYGASGIIDDIDDYLFDGDYLLIAEDGANLLSRSTPIAFRANGKFWVNNHAHVVSLRDDMPLNYLGYLLNGTNLQFYITGTAQPKLNQVNLNRIPIPLAPLNEQCRIVEEIEELLSDLDAGVAALERAKANLKRYRASVLKAAVDGSLTAEWRKQNLPSPTGRGAGGEGIVGRQRNDKKKKTNGFEPAQELLARILKERRRKWEEVQLAKFAASGKQPPKNWKSKYKEPLSPDTTNLPDLPEGWCWARVEQIGIVQLGRQRSPRNRSRNYPTKYIRAANLTENGLDLSDVLDMEFLPSALECYRLAEGDILLSEASGSPDQVGKPAIWNNEIEECCFQNTVIRLKSAQISHQFLLAVFQHFYFNKVFAGIAAGVGINHLSAAKFSHITIPLPPFEEQEVIGIEVAERLSQIQTTDIVIDHTLQRAARLRQSILKQAFEGKLVAQDPADEPASALLARIKKCQTTRVDKEKTKAVVKPKKTVSKGPFFRQAAVVSYAVRRLAPCKSFGRTQLEKTLHLAQSHLGINLEFEFERQAAGPFDKAIYRIEGAARKNDWFATQERKNYGVRYKPGAKIDTMCRYAKKYLDTKQAAFDQLLDHISQMNTDQAELFATTYAAWNDLLIDNRPADDNAITAEIYGWDASKAKFTRSQINRCLVWMRQHQYVPTGQGQHTTVISKTAKLNHGIRNHNSATDFN